MSNPFRKKEPLDPYKVLSKLLMHLLDQINHHKHFSIQYYTDIKVDHWRDFTRAIRPNPCIRHRYHAFALVVFIHRVHQLHRKRLHIHHYRNRWLLEDFEDILIQCFQYQHITNHQSRNLLQDNHIPNSLRKNKPLDFHKVLSKLLMHFLDSYHHHKHFSIHY